MFVSTKIFSRSFNLQDMCLDAIVRNIDLFVYKKTLPQNHVDFLFRAYGAEVFSKHKILKSSVSEDCMLWFLNPHLKKLTLPYKYRSERIIQQLKMIGSGITFLNLHNSKVSENELNSVICSIPNVIDLDLSNTSCNNKTLACIRKFCPDLKRLSISGCGKVTDKGLKNLCGGQLSLKYLNILDCEMRHFGIITLLNRMRSLECVKHDELINLLYESGKYKQYNITELVYNNMLRNHMKVIRACARMCPKLKKLYFEYAVDENVLKACTNFQNLEELKIKMSHKFYIPIQVNDVLSPILPISKNLKTLILSCVMQISVLMLIENFENLENLYLKKVGFEPFKEEDIKSTKTKLFTLVVKDVDMEADTIYEAVALLISLSRNVIKLHFNYIEHLPSEIFEIISKSMKNLISLNLDYTSFDMYSLNQLFEMPFLATISTSCLDTSDLEDNIFATNLSKKTTCTLSWCCIYDSDDRKCGNLDDVEKSRNTYCYDDCTDESDIISDQCHSTTSESDDEYGFLNEYGLDDEIIDWVNYNQFHDPYGYDLDGMYPYY